MIKRDYIFIYLFYYFLLFDAYKSKGVKIFMVSMIMGLLLVLIYNLVVVVVVVV